MSQHQRVDAHTARKHTLHTRRYGWRIRWRETCSIAHMRRNYARAFARGAWKYVRKGYIYSSDDSRKVMTR